MTATPSEPGPRLPALIELLRAAETIWQGSRGFFARWELSPSQFNVLNLLRLSAGGLTQIELSRELLMHRSNLTGLVDQLERRGLVTRRQVAGDRRANRVELTAAGRKLVHRILPEYHRGAEAVLADLGVPEAGRLAAMCQHITARAHALADNLPARPATAHEA